MCVGSAVRFVHKRVRERVSVCVSVRVAYMPSVLRLNWIHQNGAPADSAVGELLAG